ncbi:MAG: hypothetical protein WD510_00905 [Balneolaceae bacterium]
MSAQQVQDTEGSLLPDINPQDIEIRSQYQARFPGLRRQPILGFNPRPRVYQVDPNRAPYLESYEEIIAQLPVGEISRPAPPEYLSPLFPDPKHGYGHLGAGSYLTPESGIYANTEIGENHWLTGNLDYRSSAGHRDEPATSFRFLNLETGYRGKLDPSTVLGMTLSANSDFNRMLELSPSVIDRMDGTARKEYRGLNLDTRITRFKNKIESWNVGIGGMYQAMDLDAGNVTPLTSDIEEWGITLDANKNWIGERLHEQYGFQTDVQTGGYQSSGLSDSQFWHMAGAGGRYEQLFDYKTKVDASLMVYHVSDAVDQTFYVSPDLNVEFYLMDEVTFTGSVSGKPEHPRHISYHRENRFLTPDNLLRHSYHLKGSAGISVEFYPGNKLSGGISYQDSKNYPYYSRRDLSSVFSGGDSGYYQIQYGRASVFKIHGGYSADLIPGQLWVNLNAWWQDPKLTEEDIKVPFEENLGLHGAVTVRPVQQVLFEAWGDFTGTRTAPGISDMNPFIHIGSRVEVRVSEKVGIYGKILNLLNQSYEIWEGYPERPFQVYGGVSLIF